MQTIHDEKEQQTSENQDLTKKKAKLELNIKDIQDELEGDKSARVTIILFFYNQFEKWSKISIIGND